MTTGPYHRGEEDGYFTELTCKWCSDSDEEQPCGDPECEALAVRAARTRRISGLVDAMLRATRLRCLYMAERIPGDHRIVELDAQVDAWDAQVRDALDAQRREDAATCSTQPAPALTESDADAVVSTLLADDFAAMGRAS